MAAFSHRLLVIAPERLHVRRWDDEAVVYDDRTGDTHLLSALAHDVLLQLMRAPSDRVALLTEMGEADPHAVDAVVSRLIELDICADAS